MSGPSDRTSPRMVGAAILGTLSGSLPVFLLGGLSVQVAAEIGISSVQLGLLFAVFFAGSAVTSVTLGYLIERLGARRSMLLASMLGAISLGGIGVATSTVAMMAVFLTFGSLSNAVVQPAANLLIARGVPVQRRGLVFGFKQAAVPLGSMLAGAAVPTIGLTVGWRVAFVAATALPVLAALLTPSAEGTARPAGAGTSGRDARPESPVRALALLAIASGTATAAATTLGTFLVVAAVTQGIAPGQAGVLLSIGGASSVATRVLFGWRADRVVTGHLRVVRGMMMTGVVGFVMLAVSPAVASPLPLLALGTFLAFAGGWGWNGLLTHAVVERNRSAPAAATGITQTGLYAGGMLGPLLFGLVSDRFGFPAGWWMGVGLLVIAIISARAGERGMDGAATAR